MNPVHHLSDSAKHAVDVAAFASAGVAVASLLSQLAVIVTILAGLASLALALFRLHDRLKYGPARGRE